MSAAAFDDVLAGGRGEDGALVFESGEPARPAVFVPFPGDLDPRVQSALIGAGISGLYGHQADVWEAAQRGEHVCVSTGTASGKSLAFTLPVLAAVCERKTARALYIYPTKALAQDQARALRAYGLGLRPAVYDGDTPREQRHLVRRFANPILTNPDMLHVGVLPNHRRWADVLSNLTHVVIDEAHTYRGVFGSHVALVLRRLRRVCALYGCEPQFLLASATIANPAEACAALTGLDVRVVDRDGAPRAPRRVAFWDTPLLDEAEGTRGSALGEAAGLLAALTARGLRTICFVKSRKASELVFRASPRTAPATRRRSAAASRATSSRDACSASSRRRLWNWEWTSGCSTARSRSAFRERSRASGSSGAARAGAGRASHCSCPAPTLSTATSSTIPRRCWGGPTRPRSSTRRIPRSASATCEPPLTSCRSRTPTTTYWVEAP
jgi:ATP-dependent helicase YprA (DUF1998 family)